MTDPTESIGRILREAANNLQIPTPVAQLLMQVAVELGRQNDRIAELASELQRAKAHHDEHVIALNRRIDRLSGVHGA